MYRCEVCNENFNFREEVVLLCGDLEVNTSDEYGSGDIDSIICGTCYDKKFQ